VIVYSGRLKRAKRPDHALRAFKIVKKRVPDAELWVIGSGAFEEQLRKMTSDGIRFFGSIQDDERRELISKSWTLVNPSVREGFGLNIVEANALGVPCVAYDVAGLKDAIIENETGLLVKSGDVEALAEATFQILTNEDTRVRLSENALAYSKGFSWDKVAEGFMGAMRSI
jgi:glycosyltransferase involved in cell wall biosynthesis